MRASLTPKHPILAMPLDQILYIEDDDDIRQVVSLLLSSEGIQVHAFATSEQAIEAAPGLQPDIILLDVMMPGLNGFDTLNHLRTLSGYARIPAVFLTAREEPDSGTLEPLHPVAVIPKPFEPGDLAERLRAILRDLRPN